jgi:hypothetical protein
MDFIVLMGLLFVLGLILARYKPGASLDQIKNAPNDEHQIPTFVALHEPPSHH